MSEAPSGGRDSRPGEDPPAASSSDLRIALRSLQRDPTSARSYILLAEVQEKRVGRHASRDLLQKAVTWADASELAEIESHLRRLNALDDLAEILPTTQPQLIQA